MSSVIVPKQTINPSAQGMSSVVVPQELTADKTTKELSSISVLINSAAEDILSVGSADPPQGTIQTASSSQRQEIALKQVSQLINRFALFILALN